MGVGTRWITRSRLGASGCRDKVRLQVGMWITRNRVGTGRSDFAGLCRLVGLCESGLAGETSASPCALVESWRFMQAPAINECVFDRSSEDLIEGHVSNLIDHHTKFLYFAMRYLWKCENGSEWDETGVQNRMLERVNGINVVNWNHTDCSRLNSRPGVFQPCPFYLRGLPRIWNKKYCYNVTISKKFRTSQNELSDHLFHKLASIFRLNLQKWKSKTK